MPRFPFTSHALWALVVASVGGLAFPVAGRGQWNLVQNATQLTPTCVQLTTTSPAQRGAAWHDCQIHLGAPFDLEFTVNLGSNNGGADGVCFILQQAGNTGNNLVGNSGGSIGYNGGPFNPSVGVEIDTWQNGDVGDPSYDHIGIGSNGSNNHNLSAPVQAHVALTNIETGTSYPFRVTWDPATTTLQVYFAGTLRKTLNLNLTTAIFGGNPLVYWGFTGTTGGATNVHSFCLVDAYYSTHLESVTASPEGPWLICGDQEVDLTAVPLAPATTAEWVSTGSPLLTANEAGTYELYAEDANGCPTHSDIEVQAAPGPELTLLVDENLVVCGPGPVELSAAVSPGSQVQWDGANGASITTSESGEHTVVAQLNGCTETAVVEVLFQQVPVVSFEIDGEPVEGEVDVCFGESLTMDALGSVGSAAAWALSGTDELTINSSGDYWATASINGCNSEPDFLHVNLLPLPTANLEALPPTLCWGTTGQILAEASAGATISNWVMPAGTSALGQAGPGLYQATVVSENGCVQTESLSLNMFPPIATGLVDPEPLCDENVAVLQITQPVDNISWNTGGSSPQLQVVNTMGEGPFVATVTQGYCTETDTAWVTWWPTPDIGNHPDSIVRCVLDPPYAINWANQQDEAVGTWVWTINGEPATAGGSLVQEGNYEFVVRDNATGCMDSHAMNVEVWPNLNVVATALDPLVCIGDSSEVRVELVPVLETDPNEIPFGLYWSTEGAEGWSPTVAGGVHYVTAVNACGSDVAAVEIEEEYCGCDVWIPNAFTPDGDGRNEGLRVATNCDMLEFSLTLYNRWGEVVWEITDPESPWDGGATALGEGLHYVPDGIYPYVCRWAYTDNGILLRDQRVGTVAVLR